ncbi:hypothetical protein Pan161_57860 [Gimesia algae]|uniref:Uncharacterized protein n=1 Tax=Gimesia algae TaxID=2527971 RepID=A0A517VM41_9PLAN|nr:hypothetical protein Pan161_57860 [Gimesia algae]
MTLHQEDVYYCHLGQIQRILKETCLGFMVINVHIPPTHFIINALKTRGLLLISLLAGVYLRVCPDIRVESTVSAAAAPPDIQIGLTRFAIPVQGGDFDADRSFAVVVSG